MAEALPVDAVDGEAGGDQPIQGLGCSLQQWNAARGVLARGAAIPATSSAEESDPDILSFALDVWGDDLVTPEAAS